MAETLVNWGVRHVFGMGSFQPGVGLLSAIAPACPARQMAYIGVPSRRRAFAASAYGKLSGRPAACLTIAGPGATNLLTGLWDAKVELAPIPAFDGSGADPGVRARAFQDIDLSSAFQTVKVLATGAAQFPACRADVPACKRPRLSSATSRT